MKRSFPFRTTGGELRRLDQPGYYPGYSTLAQKHTWDKTTQRAIVERVEDRSPLRFFTDQQAALLAAIVDRLLPQDDRAPERTIPIVPFVDQRLSQNAINGFRYEDMPPDQEAYRLGLRALQEMAHSRYGTAFIELEINRQELLLKSLHDGAPDPQHEVWQQMPVHRFWALLMEDCLTAYYSHPWAWDEIGFGGPAYPRGYMRLENGLPEPWEVEEARYDWNAPADSVSDVAPDGPSPQPNALQGHGGSH